MFSAFCNQTFNAVGPNIIKGHGHHQIENDGIAGLEKLVRFYNAAVVVQLKKRRLHLFPAKKPPLHSKISKKIG